MNDIPIEELPIEETWGPEPDVPPSPLRLIEMEEARKINEQVKAGYIPF